MKSHQKFLFQDATELPLKEVVKFDGPGIAIIVQTPMGEETIDYQQVDNPMFGAARNVEVPASKIIYRLRELERDSKDYLLTQWKRSLSN